MCLYVDDMLMAARDKAVIALVKAGIAEKFRIKDLGRARFILSIEIDYAMERRTLSICQQSYTEAIIKKFGQENAKPSLIPLEPGLQLTKDDDPQTDEGKATRKSKPPRSLIGNLSAAINWVQTATCQFFYILILLSDVVFHDSHQFEALFSLAAVLASAVSFVHDSTSSRFVDLHLCRKVEHRRSAYCTYVRTKQIVLFALVANAASYASTNNIFTARAATLWNVMAAHIRYSLTTEKLCICIPC
jgi:hypothetical protein